MSPYRLSLKQTTTEMTGRLEGLEEPMFSDGAMVGMSPIAPLSLVVVVLAWGAGIVMQLFILERYSENDAGRSLPDPGLVMILAICAVAVPLALLVVPLWVWP